MKRWYFWPIGILLLIGVLAWGYNEGINRQRITNSLENGYQRDFYTVLNQVGQLEALLGKGLVSASPGQQVFLLTEIWSRANTAQSALGQLPFMELNLSASRKFLAQMGDYAYGLAKRVARGDSLETEHKEQLQSFYQEARQYGSVLKKTEMELSKSGYRWAEALGKPGLKIIKEKQAKRSDSGFEGIKEMEQRFDGLPVLIYDGPFSDQVDEKKPKSLAGQKEEITVAEAKKKAEQFVNQLPDSNYQAIKSEEVHGHIPAYNITLDGRGRPGMITVDISVKGGQVLSFLNSRPVKETRLKEEAAEAKAKAFLLEKGYNNLVKTYGVTEKNTRWLVFVVKEDGVRLYPDQIKLQVALDDGEVIGFNGMMYLMNHHSRKLPEPMLSETEAAEKLNSDLAIKSTGLALIPMAGGREIFTYEFLVNHHDENYLIYINAETGEEENILKLILAPEGELVI